MTQGDGPALLTAGAKDRRAEFAITREMDEAIRLIMALGHLSRSNACRLLMARGIKQDPGLLTEAIQAARQSRERDATEQQQRDG